MSEKQGAKHKLLDETIDLNEPNTKKQKQPESDTALIITKLDELSKKVEAIFENIEARFENIEARFENIETRLVNIETSHDNLAARIENLEKNKSFENISMPCKANQFLISQ